MPTAVSTVILVGAVCFALIGWEAASVIALVLALANELSLLWATQ